MNSDQIYLAIENIAATSSKNEKESLIQRYGKIPLFQKVLLAGLDPFTTYGVAKVPEREDGAPTAYFCDKTFDLLYGLSRRMITGNDARDAIQAEMNRLTPASAELLKRIITKDFRAGFSESTVNKAIPNLIPTFDCMLAHKYSDHKHKLKFPVWAEPKLDGVRVLAFVNLLESSVKFFSRSGKEFTTFDHLKEPLLAVVGAARDNLVEIATDKADADGVPEFQGIDEYLVEADFMDEVVFDGEVVSGSFNKTVSEVRRKDEQATDAKFFAFDLLPMEAFEGDTKKPTFLETYTERRKRLEFVLKREMAADLPIKILPAFKLDSVDAIHSLYEQVRAKGLEGLIVKDPNGLYHRRRNHGWLKIKAEESVDVIIVDAEHGTGKYEGMLGALVVDYNGVRVNVGTGLSDEQRSSFYDAWQSDLNARNEQIGFMDLNKWKGDLLGRMIEVQYHEVTPDGSLRHPRFVRFRDDKAAA